MTALNRLECDPEHIKEFAATISLQPLGLVHYHPEVWGLPTKCFENVRCKVQQDGGRARFGWMFHYRLLLTFRGRDI